MPRSLLNLVLRHAAPDPDPDAVLLRRYVATRDESAFAALVRRHGPVVWAVCRQSVPNPADAEDVFQATFVALASAAGKVRGPERLGGWLYAAAVRIAGKAKRGHARRTKHERAAARPVGDSPVSAAMWADLLAAVHEEVAGLPPSLRAAFVLCDLQGTDAPTAAKQLGVKPNTLTGQLARARQQVAAALSKRGIAAGAVGLAVAGGLPAALANKLAGGVVPSAAVLELSSEVATMGVNKLKLLAAGLLLAGGLTASGLGLVATAGAQAPPSTGGLGGVPRVVPETGAPVSPPGGGPGALPPSGPGSGGGSPLLPPGGPGGLGGPPPMTGTTPAGPKGFEYLFVGKPGTLPDVAKVLKDKAGKGWEYTGPVDVDPSDPPKGSDFEGVSKDTRVVLVFKRGPRPMQPMGGGMSGGGMGGMPFGPAEVFPVGPGGGSGSGFSPKPVGPPPGVKVPDGGTVSPFAPSPTVPGGNGAPPALPAEANERYEVIALKKADAEEVAKLLTEVFNGPSKPTGRVRIVAEKTTNSLIVVKASDTDMKVMLKLLEAVDVEPKPKGK